MTTSARQPAQLCHLLREDSDLLGRISPRERDRAAERCVAPVLGVRRGKWADPPRPDMSRGIGLLVLDGVLIRRVGVDGRFGAELLGPGDLLRPWQGDDIASALPHSTGWRVVEAARLAVLDNVAAERLARYPALIGALAGRAVNRSRGLALTMAIIHHPRIDVRLHMLLWHLADRWGRVRSDGVCVPLRLSHSVLADLVAAQRPSVTVSLKRLAQRGLVEPLKDGWLLRGGSTPPPR